MRLFFIKKKGFTLLELLTVVSIIIILTGIIIPTINIARTRAFKAKTRARIATLELALSMYEADIGNFPEPEQQGDSFFKAEWLTTNLTNNSSWNGPYIEFKKDEVDISNIYVIDSWANKIYYKCPGDYNSASFDLWSCGKNGINNNGNIDDIVNWKD